MRTQILTAIAIIVLGTRAFAYGGRPVSDLRFDGRALGDGTAIATDGVDFMILTMDAGGVVAQKIVAGQPHGPAALIAHGAPAGLFWNGSHYVAGVIDADHLRIVHVSREGSPLTVPSEPILAGYRGTIVANGVSALAVTGASELMVRPLDMMGRPTADPLSYYGSSQRITAVAVPGGFAVVEASVRLFRADGTLMTDMITLNQHPPAGYRLNRAVVATDGTDILIVFGGGTIYPPFGELRSVLIDQNGNIKSSQVLDTNPHGDADFGLVPFGLVWDGSQYIATVSVQRESPTFDTDPAILRIARSGERASDLSWIAQNPGHDVGAGLGWNNGHLLAITAPRGRPRFYWLDPVTLNAAGPRRLGQTPASHHGVAIGADDHGYLVAWTADVDGVVVRASRIDAEGNYLDGEGLLLDVLPPSFSCCETMRGAVAVDGHGPDWIVVWSDGEAVRGAFVSRSGAIVNGSPFAIGPGDEAAVHWHNGQYVVLRSDYGSLYRDVLANDGTVAESRIVAGKGLEQGQYTIYRKPRLIVLGDALFAIYIRSASGAGFVVQVRLDSDTWTPFAIADTTGHVNVSSGGTRALLVWSTYENVGGRVVNGARGAFLSAETAGQPADSFLLEGMEHGFSVTFDGSDFLVVSLRSECDWGALVMARITASGTMTGSRTVPNTSCWYVSPTIAASAFVRPLIASINPRDEYAGHRRTMLLFADEVGATSPSPPAPAIRCATQEDDGTISIYWQPAPNLFGTAVELQLADGMFRLIGEAPGSATSARVPPVGFDRGPVRLRAWNGGGVSDPSALRSPGDPAEAVLRSTMSACAGTPATIDMTLKGAAPFTVRWSDGVVQTGLAKSATRVVTVTQPKTFRIVSVTDSCTTRETSESIRITVDPQPAITTQTHTVRIPRGERTVLTVEASEVTQFAWFEGIAGDTTRPVGSGGSSFETPTLTRSTSYWVRASNSCASVDSEPMVVTVSAKRRPSGH